MEVTSCLTLKDLIGTRRPKMGIEAEDGRRAQKENIFVDRSRTTPKTPLKNEPMDLSKQRVCTPEKNPITPVKLADRSQADPWTPTANLKMLISAASPDIRDREKKKELFRPIENNKLEDGICDALQFDVDDGTVDEFEKRPSRKQKSLGLLCQKFLARYQSYPISTEKTTISLDEVVTSLGVERRRIYDIVNVLESLHLVSRVAKNQYCWHGKRNLNQTLKNLQQIGESQKYDEQMVYFQHKEQDLEYRSGDRKRDGFLDAQGRLLEFSETDCSSASANSRKDKSLRIMSQKFVMLFLVSTTKIVTLDIAAKILIEESQDADDHSKFKTKVRRLYDIANVLTSLALIKKVHVIEERGRKPAFKWIGPVDFNIRDERKVDTPASNALLDFRSEAANQLTVTMTGKQRLSRHASFNIASSSEGVKRKVNSEPNSPQRERKAFIMDTEEYSAKMTHLAAVCREKTEENAKSRTFSQEKRTQPAGNTESVPPFSVMLPAPLDSDHCLKSFQHLVPPVGPSQMVSQASLQSGVTREVTIIPTSVSQAETTAPALISNQPYVCLRSAPVLMLCSSLPENFTDDGPQAVENHHGIAEQQVLPEIPRAISSVIMQDPPEPSSQLPPVLTEDEELVLAKKLKTEPASSPQPLALTKKSLEEADGEYLQESRCPNLVLRTPHCLELGNPSSLSSTEKDAVEQQNASRNGDLKEGFKNCCAPENAVQTSIPQYLYVPSSASGLKGFNVLLSANQPPGAVGLSSSQLASLNLPYVVVPSTSLAQLPVLCSSQVTGPLPPPLGSVPKAGPLNYGLPTLGPATHLLIGTAAMMTPQALDLSPAYQQHSWSSICSSPGLEKSCVSVKPDSPVCSQGQPVAVLKLQQSPTPQTPKNPHSAPRETFFKTPGSLDGPIPWRKSEGIQNRNTSSAQRRLEIPNGAMD
uniref:Transcription factor E2F7 n=1 Tax=Geotrypetes seraphini TaxID=260995 RepID=A0A6P8RV43_GEOSA|nr:transcription factor E2F7 isoform X2 [Geotrypetes seraphini]